jgi:DNA mismatch repair ATPase MutS
MDKDLISQLNFKHFDLYFKTKSLILDGQTLKNLDILQNSTGSLDGSLLKLMDHTVTPFGKRMFRLVVHLFIIHEKENGYATHLFLLKKSMKGLMLLQS